MDFIASIYKYKSVLQGVKKESIRKRFVFAV